MMSDTRSHSTAKPNLPGRLTKLAQGFHKFSLRLGSKKIPGAPVYCSVCWKMMTTLEGLEALASNDYVFDCGRKYGYRHHNKAELEAALTMGCIICQAVVGALDEYWYFGRQEFMQKWMYRTDEPIWVQAVTETSMTPASVSVAPTGHPFEKYGLHRLDFQAPGVIDSLTATFTVFTNDNDPSARFVHGRVPPSNLMLDSVFERLKSDREDCYLNHPECATRDVKALPRRLIDLGKGASRSTPRLCNSSISDTDGYVALSYCWGGRQQFTTTTSTLESKMKGLSPSSLPQTILDAITVTKKLGIRFLWVDSLCIVQDDRTEKLIEINRMGDIFKNAALTLIAASSRQVGDGFLGERPLEKSEVQIYTSEGEVGKIWLAKVHTHSSRETCDDPLFYRGWAFQEYVLSQRVILYDKYGVTWNCNRKHFQGIIPEYLEYSESPRSKFTSAFKLAEDHDIVFPNEAIISTWTGLVEEYSARDFTLFEDRLPAVASIARELAGLWGDEYCAGLWKAHIGWLLSWRKAKGKSQVNSSFKSLPNRGRRIGAPSWSWKSHPFSVKFVKYDYLDGDIIDCEVVLESPDLPFGDVHSGTLYLTAKILPFNKKEVLRPAINHVSSWHKIFLDYGIEESDEGIWELLLGWPDDQSKKENIVSLIVRQIDDSAEEFTETNLFGIEGEKVMQFERIGCVKGSELE